MVAEREANLTIVVVCEEDSLDQHRERARQRGNPAPYPSSPTDQDHRRAAPRISILHAPAPAAEFGTRLIYYNGPGKS